MSLAPVESILPAKWSTSDPWKSVKHAPGAYPASPNSQRSFEFVEQPSIAGAVRARRAEYIRKKNIKIKVGTWNTASVSGTAKDLGGWFVQGLGVQGLSQDLSGLSLGNASHGSNNHIESVEAQEARARKKSCTLPKHETAAIASDDDVGLYVLGLQEVVDIASMTEAMRPYYDPNPAKKWKQAMEGSLPLGYVKIAELQLLGLLILIYAAPTVAPEITSVDTASVGTGALGYMGNKGAVSVRIVLGGTTRMLFVNCHLAAGADEAALTRRIWDTNQILQRTKFSPADLDGEVIPRDHEIIGDEDFAFWFGDLNYRLDDIPGEDVRRLLLLHTRNEYDVLNKSKRKIDSELGYIDAPSGDSTSVDGPDDRADEGGKPAKESSIEPPLDPNNDPASLITTLKSLLNHDQLRAQQKLGKAFHEGWREGEIEFLPTYKYDVGSVGMFDSGEKKRSPSWCDRILYRTRRDRQQYEEKSQQAQEAKKRDDEMRARGIDQEAADQEILFEYDPASDGVDDYDEYDETEDQAHDIQRVMTREGLEDIIRLEDYISHQRVLSSDHKPLTAVFNLTYSAVIPELKNTVQQEVTRNFDKNENESRPSVTVVVETPPDSATNADTATGASELNAVGFEAVRYDVPETRTITIANTSPIPATFAFINRPAAYNEAPRPAPPWLSIHVHQQAQAPGADDDELEKSARFTLFPGDTVNIDLTIKVTDQELVYLLNEQNKKLDDILVLRILGGRDHFIRVTGVWLESSFCRTLDQLVLFPTGVRNLSAKMERGQDDNDDAIIRHSAPKELFCLTEAIPGLVERAVADWAMLHDDEDPPWIQNDIWPFVESIVVDSGNDRQEDELAAVREALDTATSFDDHLDSTVSVSERLRLLSKTLLDFLASLRDGVIPAAIWKVIESRLAVEDKAKLQLDAMDVKEIVMEALSISPVHSVSFTFITFMLTRIITELNADVSNLVDNLPISGPERRSTSSTDVSEALSPTSVKSFSSSKSKLSFLPSLTRRRPNVDPLVASSSTPQPQSDRRKVHIETYAEKLAPVIIRAEQDATVKGKEKKALESRKRRALEAFLDGGPI